MKRHRARSALAVLFCAVVAPHAARAQGEASDCPAVVADASRALSAGDVPASLTRCPSSGPPALAQLWLAPGSRSSTQREALVDASASLHDARLFRTLSGVVNGADRPTAERLAALRVLLRYYDPTFVPTDADLLADTRQATFRQRSGGEAHVDGGTPLDRAVRREIAAQLASIASGDPDQSVRKAALHARQVLAYADPVNTPVLAGAIRLVAGCGDRVTLQSTADIDLPVSVSVLGTSFKNGMGIRAGSAGKPSEVLFGLPKGTVIVTLGGRELTRLSRRAAHCAPTQVRTSSRGPGL